MQSLSYLRFRPLRTLAVALAAASLVACGSDDDDTGGVATPTTLGGVAAVGAPIAGGAVSVACAGGSPLNTTTSTSGAWQVTIGGQTLPCAVQVQGGTVGGAPNATTLHSIAYTLGTLNITPLTDLVVARSIAGDPQAWFAAPRFTGLDAAKTQAALTQIADSLGLASALKGRDPLTTAFQAVAGDAIDDALEALNAALQAVGSSYPALLAAAASGDFTAFAGLPAAVAQALPGETGGSGGGSSCTSGVQMTFTAGQAAGPFTEGQKVCVEASSTSLKIDAKTFSNPTTNPTVAPPVSAYIFTDAGLNYEVVFLDGKLYEINIAKVDAASIVDFHGQLKLSAASGGVTLTVDVTIGGVASVPITVPNQTAPTSQDEFCAGAASDPTLNGLQAQTGVTLTITGCSFANNVGTIQATAQSFGVTVPYVVKFTWGG